MSLTVKQLDNVIADLERRRARGPKWDNPAPGHWIQGIERLLDAARREREAAIQLEEMIKNAA